MVEFAFTPEHEELRQAVRKFLTDKSDEQAVRRCMQTTEGYSPDVWTQMAEQMALQGLIVPERFGGSGLGPIEVAIVCEEMGRVLLCAPYLSSAVVAVNALVLGGTEAAQAELLPAIASGQTVATLAMAEPDRGWDASTVAMKATASGGAWRLNGSKTFVLDGHVAHVLLVAARTKDGVSLFRIDGDADGVGRELLPTLDLTRKLARVTFTRARAHRVGREGDLTAVLARVQALAVAALAAEQAGGAQRCLEVATEYARTRLQFGRPIGSFQAVKHKCADMLVATEFAKSAAYHAAFRAAEGPEDEVLAAAAMAKSYCSEAYVQAAGDNIQVHGGMGFTWEHPAHLYLKRAKSSSLLFGDPVHYRAKLAEQLGL
jgi:alkylation response protein AidB-like acyl-CoA dehydrogenase